VQAAVQAVFDGACAADFQGMRYDTHEAVESGHGNEEGT
jgi:hypothetical protein